MIDAPIRKEPPSAGQKIQEKANEAAQAGRDAGQQVKGQAQKFGQGIKQTAYDRSTQPQEHSKGVLDTMKDTISDAADMVKEIKPFLSSFRTKNTISPWRLYLSLQTLFYFPHYSEKPICLVTFVFHHWKPIKTISEAFKRSARIMDTARENVASAGEKIQQSAGDVAEAGREAGQQAKGQAQEFAEGTRQTASDTSEQAQEQGKGMLGKMKESISETAGKVQDKGKGMVESIKETFSRGN
ncbi:hypothetical protein GHT06_022424 [Daphnia sinensis]|uniref:Uncharacterized protein n=1 Tax=Daphnia sinensis TaxID=1820382 RepID=A0AAD5KH21_9CRUS|nr:hypothetical protein GHT06_022424 [Daphnia sinensis]